MKVAAALAVMLSACGPGSAPGPAASDSPTASAQAVTREDCDNAASAFMEVDAKDEKALEHAFDATLENCDTVGEWARAAKRAGGGMYGPPHMMANMACADYRRRKGPPIPQPICSEAVALSGGFDFGEEPKGEAASEAEAMLRSLMEDAGRRHDK